ncbi:MAG: hypothetical protein Kow0092_22920 [Deferrisomatales bacterium]
MDRAVTREELRDRTERFGTHLAAQGLAGGARRRPLRHRGGRAAGETPWAPHFLGNRRKVAFVGPGLGLEVDEYPFPARGFDLLLEPTFAFPGQGVVGIEDTFRVTEGGVERLTTSPQTWGVA